MEATRRGERSRGGVHGPRPAAGILFARTDRAGGYGTFARRLTRTPRHDPNLLPHSTRTTATATPLRKCLARLHAQYKRNPKGAYTAFPAGGASTNPMHSAESDSDEGLLTDSDDDGQEDADAGLELADMRRGRGEPPGDDV